MSRSVTLTIPGDPAELSPNARLHRMARARLVARWKEGSWNRWYKAGRIRLAPPVLLQFTVRRGRPMDRDNLAGSGALKAFVDGLTDRGSPYGRAMIADDHARLVFYAPLILENGKQWAKQPEVVLTAWEATEEELGLYHRAHRSADADPAPRELAAPPGRPTQSPDRFHC